MKRAAPALLLLLCLSSPVLAWNEEPLHDHFVGFFKEVEAIFSWHVEDRKTLKEVAEETWQGILA